MKNFYMPLWLITALLTLIGTPSPSQAQIATGVSANFQNYECNLSGLADGMPGCRNASLFTTPIALTNDSTKLTCGSGTYCGARSDSGTTAVLPIDAFGTCAWVDNYSTNSLFVPFGSSTDWQDFRTNAPINDKHLIVITNCALPYSVSNSPKTINVTPYPDCDTAAVDAPDIYGRSPNPGSRVAPSTWTAPAQSFTCHNGMTIITSNLQWVAGDSTSVGRNALSWNQHFTYSPDIQFTVTEKNNPANTGTSITVAANTAVTLSWTTTGATRCEAVDGWSSDTAVTTGNNPVEVTPVGKITYMLKCSNDVGASTATVTVDAAAVKPAQCGSYAFVGLLDGSGLTPSSNLPFCAVGTPNQTTFPISSAVSNAGTFYVPYKCSNGSSTVSCSAIWVIQMAPAGVGAGGW